MVAFEAEVEMLYQLRRLLRYLLMAHDDVASNDALYYDPQFLRDRERLRRMARYLSVKVGQAVGRADAFRLPDEAFELDVREVPDLDDPSLTTVEQKPLAPKTEPPVCLFLFLFCSLLTTFVQGVRPG